MSEAETAAVVVVIFGTTLVVIFVGKTIGRVRESTLRTRARERARREIAAAVAAGVITPEEGAARMAAASHLCKRAPLIRLGSKREWSQMLWW